MDAITFELMKCAICHYFNQYPVQDSNIKITEDKDKKRSGTHKNYTGTYQ
jgi:hypothetical protein